jgi:hypothetical protein
MGTWEEEWLDMTKDIQGSVIDYTKPGSFGGNLDYLNNNFVPSVNIDPTDAMGYDKLNKDLQSYIKTISVEATPDVPANKDGNGGGQSGGGGGGEQFLRAGSTSPVKIATPQYVDILNKTTFSPMIESLYFEQLNGLVLLSLTNSANLNTENVNYQPIINMAEIQRYLDPKGVLALQNTSDKYFLNFPIKLDTKIPNVGNGPLGTNVYIDTATGNLVIESINLNPGENIEIQTLQNGTIYETDLGVDEA